MIAARFARLNSDGTTDPSFEVGANAEVFCVAVRDDGSALIGGDFSSVKGEPCTRLALVGADGEVDTSFALSANGTVRAAVAQADSKFIVGGSFTSIAGTPRNRIARITAAGELELSFNPNADDIVHALGQQGDGKIMVGGEFANIGGGVRANYARLLNDPAASTLTVQSSTTILWERAGTTPETQRATFDLSTDGGMSWTPLGEGTAVLGGWTLTGLTLSADGQIRARAYPPSSSSQGVVEEIVNFDFVPEIQVEQPEGTILVDASSTLDYGTTQVGTDVDKVFTIRNVGLANLVLTTPTQVSVTGTQWTVLAQPATPITPGSVSTFTVRFSPDSDGSKTSTLTILSDDADEATFMVSLAGVASPGPGSRDDSYQPVANGVVYASSVDSNERVLLGGLFTSINGSTRNRFARVSTLGVNDSSVTGTAANALVQCVSVLPDGNLLVGGSFTSFNGVTRNRLVKVSSTGVLDTSFANIAYNSGSTINTILPLPDGKILVAGSFSFTSGGIIRSGIIRLLSTGALDTTFSPGPVSTSTFAVAVQTDGNILVGAGVQLFRLLPSGAKDTTFGTAGIVTTNGIIQGIQVDEDGNVVVGGTFTNIGGVAKSYLARLSPLGVTEAGFTASVAGSPYSVTQQANGSILAVSYSDIERVLTDGSADTTFSVGITAGQLTGSSSLSDGRVNVTGDFAIEGTASVKTALLFSDTAISSLSVVSPSAVQWLRSGASPEALYTLFEYSQDSGATWVSLGQGTRVAGGWELTGISLPISGVLRGLACVIGGYYNGSASLLESRVTFSGLAVPDISVQQPTNTNRAEGSTVVFTGRLVGQTGTLTFTIANPGNAPLTGISVVSTNAGEFSVTSLGATSLASGGSTTFDIQFTPSATGSRTAQLIISSSVPGAKNPYSLNLQGNGITTPLATTQSAQSITSSMATLRGSVTARDDTSAITFQYRIGSAGAWTTVAAVPPSASGFTATPVTRALTSLVNNTGYQFRVGITNSVTGSSSPVYGAILSFTTLP